MMRTAAFLLAALAGPWALSGCADRGSTKESGGDTDSGEETTNGGTTDPGTTDPGTSSDTGGSTGGEEPGIGEWVFDPDELRTYYVEVAPEDWDWLNQDPTAEIYVPATVEVDGVELGPIGLRYKGSYGSLDSCIENGVVICSKLSMKLRFDEYVPDQFLDGLKRLNFHSMEKDPSKLHDRLGYGLFRDFGVAASRAVHANLVINGELQGVFSLVEQVDGRFTRASFADGEGNLYKEVWPEHFTEMPYLDALKTNRDENPSASKMVAFATELQAASPDEMGAVFDKWTDRKTLARLLAVDRLIENWDGIVGFWCVNGNCGNHNYYWYEEVGSDRIWLVPWDLDHTFDNPNPFKAALGQAHWADLNADCTPIPIIDQWLFRRAASCDHIIRGLVVSMWDDYVVASNDLLDTLYTETEINGRIDAYAAQIAPAVAADPDLTVSTWENQVEVLRQATVALRASIAAEVGG